MKRASTLAVHQVLHGYSDGHRLLSSSAPSLVAKDQQTMLVMSDASGMLEGDGPGYLTGYPLEASGLYAFARTWSAPELPRPGCVWTHTVLIDFADLASIHNLWHLRELFVRPIISKSTEYSGLLKVDVDTQYYPVPKSTDDFSEQLVSGLYGSSKNSILPGAPLSEAKELIVLQAWSQQWPRLRRTFRFCTYAASDSSAMQSSFDLQFVSRANLRSTPSTDRDGSSTEKWVKTAVEDLHRPSSLRTFLREIAIDLPAIGREAFADMVEIYSLLTTNCGGETFDRAVEVAERNLLKVDGGEKLRLHLLRLCLQGLGVDVLSEARVAFIRENSRRLTPELLGKASEEIAPALWSTIPGELSAWLGDSDQAKRSVAFQIVRSVRSEQIVAALPLLGDSTADLISARPEVLTLPEIWARASVSIRRKLLDLVPPQWSHWPETISAMMVGGASEIAMQVRKSTGSERFIASVVDHVSGHPATGYARTDLDWLRAAVVDPGAVAQYLGSGRVMSLGQLYTLAQCMAPDDVPNTVGHDPWFEALRSAGPSSGRLHENEFLSAYLLARALGYRSRSQGELISATLDIVYLAAADSTISPDSWSLLNPKLPDSTFWFAWDKCRRIREGVVDTFINRSLSADLFSRVTESEELFEDLVRLASEHRGGRRYLREVQSALKRSTTAKRSRYLVIDKFV